MAAVILGLNFGSSTPLYWLQCNWPIFVLVIMWSSLLNSSGEQASEAFRGDLWRFILQRALYLIAHDSAAHSWQPLGDARVIVSQFCISVLPHDTGIVSSAFLLDFCRNA